MKSIAVVTDTNSKLAKFLKSNLEVVFNDCVKINNYYLNELKEDALIEDDIVLIMIKERAMKVHKHVKDTKRIIVLDRTIKEKEIYKIFSIPEGVDVLVVNDNKETTLEMLSLLYQLGINHLNLIPYEEGKDYSYINIAITPGESRVVPTYINEIIDVGDRCIDMSAFLKIITMLNIDNREVSNRLIKYSDNIVNLDIGVKDRFKEVFLKNEEMDTIINLSKDGILLTTKDGEIALYNKSFKDIFNFYDNLVGKSINELFTFDMKKLNELDEINNEVIKYKNKYLNINKKSVMHFGKKTAQYYNIQEITYIKQLEQNLSKKLREKGQISRYKFGDMVTNSKSMLECIKLAKKLATSDLTVLITGESGTGKELLAQSIHNASKRNKQPFIAVNCAAMPENLLESELFGYEGGAFTGALKEGKEGLFEQAHNGTIFLDEIGDMPLLLQTKLLRVLQERQVMRIGSQKVMDIDVRVVAATNKNLVEMINRGEFRVDLYYRLNVLPINIPSLKERRDDIIPLMQHFMNRKFELTEEVRDILHSYDWPGNIRELKNIVDYISLMCETEMITAEDLPFYMLQVSNNFQIEMNALEAKGDTFKATEILKIVQAYNEVNKTLGRSNIVKIFIDKGINITEGEVRRILTVLNELKFINSSVGRKGSEITTKGKNFINWLDNRNLA